MAKVGILFHLYFFRIRFSRFQKRRDPHEQPPAQLDQDDYSLRHLRDAHGHTERTSSYFIFIETKEVVQLDDDADFSEKAPEREEKFDKVSVLHT